MTMSTFKGGSVYQSLSFFDCSVKYAERIRTSCRKKTLGVFGLPSEHKICACLQVLAYGAAADSFEQYFRIAGPMFLVSIGRFTRSVIDGFKEEYLRNPTARDTRKILARSRDRGFPGKIGSIDCSKWRWKNCPTAWPGQLTGKEISLR
jgi:hypothetical protein